MERKIHLRENWLIFLGILGEAELILKNWGAKEKYFQGAEEFGEINALFSGIIIKGAQTPLVGRSLLCIYCSSLDLRGVSGFDFLKRGVC